MKVKIIYKVTVDTNKAPIIAQGPLPTRVWPGTIEAIDTSDENVIVVEVGVPEDQKDELRQALSADEAVIDFYYWDTQTLR